MTHWISGFSGVTALPLFSVSNIDDNVVTLKRTRGTKNEQCKANAPGVGVGVHNFKPNAVIAFAATGVGVGARAHKPKS